MLKARGCTCAPPMLAPATTDSCAQPLRLGAVPQGLLSLVGATACVTFSYIFPGLLVLRCQRSALQRAGAAGLLALGAAMAGIALYNRLTGRGGE